MIYVYDKQNLKIKKHYAISNEIVDDNILAKLVTDDILFDIDLITQDIIYHELTNSIIEEYKNVANK